MVASLVPQPVSIDLVAAAKRSDEFAVSGLETIRRVAERYVKFFQLASTVKGLIAPTRRMEKCWHDCQGRCWNACKSRQ